MIKYIVYWCLINVVQISCPNQQAKDEFGGTSPWNMVTAMYCTDVYYDCENAKEFTNRDSAVAFYDRALESYNVDSVRIDSIYIYK